MDDETSPPPGIEPGLRLYESRVLAVATMVDEKAPEGIAPSLLACRASVLAVRPRGRFDPLSGFEPEPRLY